MSSAHWTATRTRALGLAGVLAALGSGLHCGGSEPSPALPHPPEPGVMCTEIGCADGLQIALSPDSAWAPGRYRFVIVADGQTTVCEGALPLSACEQSPSLHCDREGVLIGESGCALAAEAHGFSSVELAAGPGAVSVTIERDGSVIATRAFAPHYREVQPNGPACGPVCRQAREELALPP